MTFDLQVLPAHEWASETARQLGERIAAQPTLRLCLPTGDTPSPLYAALVARRPSLADASIVLLDEFLGLAPGDPARCDARLRRELIDHLEPPPAAFHTIDVDGPDPDAAARRYDRIAEDGLDLTLVGLGANGHVGMNEPGSDARSPTRAVTLARETITGATDRYGAGAAPSGGITLGMDRILASSEVWLLVTGERKAAMLARALLGPETPDVPASYLRRHPRFVVMADDAAARGLAASGERAGTTDGIPAADHAGPAKRA